MTRASSGHPWRSPDGGSATLLVVIAATVLLMVGAALTVVVAMVADHRRAQAAADLAALAGAQALARGSDGCATAAGFAQANGARLLSCVARGREIEVRVEVSGPRWLGQTPDLTARARAGPASSAARVRPRPGGAHPGRGPASRTAR
jgi:secretion/DNA translocation related TadE-like protein